MCSTAENVPRSRAARKITADARAVARILAAEQITTDQRIVDVLARLGREHPELSLNDFFVGILPDHARCEGGLA